MDYQEVQCCNSHSLTISLLDDIRVVQMTVEGTNCDGFDKDKLYHILLLLFLQTVVVVVATQAHASMGVFGFAACGRTSFHRCVFKNQDSPRVLKTLRFSTKKCLM
jgi:hypothetical protein